jgi:hypothetical protein
MIKAGLILEQCKIVSYMSLEGSLLLEVRCILRDDASSAERHNGRQAHKPPIPSGC